MNKINIFILAISQEFIQNKTVKFGDDININCRLNLTTKFLINIKQTLILNHLIEYKWFKDTNDKINESERIVSFCSTLIALVIRVERGQSIVNKNKKIY